MSSRYISTSMPSMTAAFDGFHPDNMATLPTKQNSGAEDTL